MESHPYWYLSYVSVFLYTLRFVTVPCSAVSQPRLPKVATHRMTSESLCHKQSKAAVSLILQTRSTLAASIVFSALPLSPSDTLPVPLAWPRQDAASSRTPLLARILLLYRRGM